ncbi:hypothetical protein, partial [Vibrio phage VP16T]
MLSALRLSLGQILARRAATGNGARDVGPKITYLCEPAGQIPN